MNHKDEITTHGGGTQMDNEQAREVGDLLRRKREELGYSIRQLARSTNINDVTVGRIEQGQFSNPAPDKLARIAEVLQLELADVFAAVGYAAPSQLPTWRPYLRAKYTGLPNEAVDELESFFGYLRSKYGVAAHGPALGEDEMTTEEWKAHVASRK